MIDLSFFNIKYFPRVIAQNRVEIKSLSYRTPLCRLARYHVTTITDVATKLTFRIILTYATFPFTPTSFRALTNFVHRFFATLASDFSFLRLRIPSDFNITSLIVTEGKHIQIYRDD